MMHSGNDVEGCRSDKILVQPNMRVFLQYSVIATIHLWNHCIESSMSLLPLSLVSIKPITTTTKTNPKSRQND